MEAVLKRIEELLQPNSETSIVLTSNKTEFTNNFNYPVKLNANRKYKMALTRLETYNSIPNITSENNKFVYSVNSVNYTVIIPIGSYEIKQINDEIQRQMVNNGHAAADNKYYIEIGANTATLCSYVRITNASYSVDMDLSSIKTLLGFSGGVLTSNYQESDAVVDIIPVNSIMVNCDLISGSYVNESEKPVVYSFFPNVSPGYKIVEIPRQLIYLPIIATDRIHSIRVWLTDQAGKLIDLRGEKLTIKFHLMSY
jgi:hypothetical protein